MDSFTIKRGDTSPVIRRSFRTETRPLVIPEGSSVVFSMARAVGRALVVDRQRCQIIGNEVIYYWQDDDTAVAGTYISEFEITYPDGSVETAPNGGPSPQDAFIQINITPDLA